MQNHNIRKVERFTKKVLALESTMRALDDAGLRGKTDEFRRRLANGETQDDIAIEAFAVVREAARRVLGMEPYPVQITGGKLISDGCIAEIKTGEGKTLICTMPVYLNALSGQGAHVITVNDYLATRDSRWMGRVYRFLGLTVGLVVHNCNDEERRAAYACDVTYATNVEIGFDYLRDNMVDKYSDKVQRGLHFAVIDEADSVLIDDAKTPLIISGSTNERDERYRDADRFVKSLHGIVVADIEAGQASRAANFIKNGKPVAGDPYEKYADNYDYVACEKDHSVVLMPNGEKKADEYFHGEDMTYFINIALKANTLYKRDIDYMVTSGGEVVIIDLGTGRLMPGRRFVEGVHQGLEAKENVEIKAETVTVASITYQNLFCKYDTMSGMTGTAMTEKDEFADIYGLEVIAVPTNKPVIRKDYADEVYSTLNGKMHAVALEVGERHELGQPVLIGTSSVEESEAVHQLLINAKIPHSVLNAREHEKEAAIVAQAGRLGAVTVATNMAGRGTDILLGGDPAGILRQELTDAGEAINDGYYGNEWMEGHEARYAELVAQCKAEGDAVRELGGLFVLGTERHVSRRIDNQLRGRAGRQGDPGESLFVLSLEDDLLRLYGLGNIKALMGRYMDANTPLDFRLLSDGIKTAQKNVEGMAYAQRKQTMDYDAVDAVLREKVYSQRDEVLLAGPEYLETMLYDTAARLSKALVAKAACASGRTTNDEYNDILRDMPNFGLAAYDDLPSKGCASIAAHIESTLKGVLGVCLNHVDDRADFCRRVLLSSIDKQWMFTLSALDDVKKKARLESVGGKNPLLIYRTSVFAILTDLQLDTDRQLLKELKLIQMAAEQATV